jgi:D-alanyl-D-alanine carboxypeptidase (penicillin-binding protein 5/6)
MSTPSPFSRSRARLLAATLVSGLAAVTVLAGAGAAPARAAGLPPPPACANAIATFSGRATSPPTPLPTVTSAVGGQRLSEPGLQVEVPAQVPRPPALRAVSWLVADLDSGDVVASCNAHVPLAPASTLKILTSLALVHRLAWSTRYVGRREDAATDGTRVGIVPGSTYSVRDLFHGLMLSSGNDAATALSALAGGMPATAALMNALARRLGGHDTRAVNDSGLDAPGQVTSAYDLALFGRAALADPLLARLVATTTYAFPGKGDRPPRASFQIQSHNHLLFTYPGATGVKNGYTVAAGGSFVGSATRNGHRYLVTLLHAQGSTWQLAEQLLNWAFTAGPKAAPLGRLVAPGEADAATATAGAPHTTRSTTPPAALAAGHSSPAATATPAKGSRTGWIALGGLAVLLLAGLRVATARAGSAAGLSGGAPRRARGGRR